MVRWTAQQHVERDIETSIDAAWWYAQIDAAFARRRRIDGANAYRVVHAEGDGLPGLTVDRYEDTLVLQCAALGMDLRVDVLARLLRDFRNKNR